MGRWLLCVSLLFCPLLTGFSAGQEKSNADSSTSPSKGARSELSTLQTIAEKSNYLATAREQEVLEFLNALDQASPWAVQTTIGKTTEGRPLQALVVAKEKEMPKFPLEPSDHRLVIFLLGGIHSGESDSKEALLALMRDLLADDSADSQLASYLEKTILVCLPNFNADGNERISTLHRPGQEGPDRGMGIRENAFGMDLNRDFIKLDTPEVRALVQTIDAWDVDVLMDAHTTNGSLHQYDLTYDVPHNPAAPKSIVHWLRDDMLPRVTESMLQQGFPTFYYGNFSADRKRWESFGHEPRYSTEYMGLRGKMSILVESYSYASYQRRIDASYLFIEECLKEIVADSERLYPMLHPASLPEKLSVPIQAKIVADSKPVQAKGFSWLKEQEEQTDNATSGKSPEVKSKEASGPQKSEEYPAPKDRKRKSEMAPTDFEVQLLNVGEATLMIDAPEYYFVPADNAWVAGRLNMHGIDMVWLDANSISQLKPQSAIQYRIASRKDLPEYQNHRMRKVDVTPETIQWQPASGWLVPTRQPLGTLAAYLLEPHSDDSLAVWNFFDPGLQAQALYPVVRIVSSDLPEMKPNVDGQSFAQEELSLEKIYDPEQRVNFTGGITQQPRWMEGQEAYLIQHEGRWHSVDCETGGLTPFDRPTRLADALGKLDAFNGGQANGYSRRINVFDNKFENALIEHKGDFYLFQAGTDASNDSARDTVRQITHSPDQSKELVELSPTAKHVAYIHDNNLFVVDCQSTEVKQLTTDGGGEIYNGKLDWVYQEEIYGRGQFRGYWWSPDGTKIAYLRLDETKVPTFRIDNSLSYAQKIEELRYPKSGQPNPTVSLHVVDIASGKQEEIPLDGYPPEDRLIVRVGWRPSPANEVVYQVQNRIQSKLDVLAYDVQTKGVRKLVAETSPAWVDVIDEPRWLKDGSFLWLSDLVEGRRHLYRIAADGTRTAITEGPWDVKSIAWVGEDSQQVLVTAHHSSPTNTDLLRIDLNSNKIEPIGETTGVHRVNVHSKGNYFFDSWSDIKTQSQSWLRKADGTKLRYIGGYRNDRFDYLKCGSIELFEIAARDGFNMQAMLYKPSDFEHRIKQGKLPVLIYVYGGPAAPTVENASSTRYSLWHRYLAEQGICVLLCDNRSALGRGNSDTWKIYKDMGSAELRDLEDAIGWLSDQSWVDADRIGMWGWSYGGYFTAYAMTHCKLLKAGIAGAPVTDWHNYDSVYTERYMDTPQANPSGYKSSSVVAAAKDLHGNLMIMHGEIDDNVHMANTMQLAHALQKANKKFDLMIYPNNRHGISDQEQSYHQYQTMTNFFKKHLLGKE